MSKNNIATADLQPKYISYEIPSKNGLPCVVTSVLIPCRFLNELRIRQEISGIYLGGNDLYAIAVADIGDLDTGEMGYQLKLHVGIHYTNDDYSQLINCYVNDVYPEHLKNGKTIEQKDVVSICERVYSVDMMYSPVNVDTIAVNYLSYEFTADCGHKEKRHIVTAIMVNGIDKTTSRQTFEGNLFNAFIYETATDIAERQIFQTGTQDLIIDALKNEFSPDEWQRYKAIKGAK